MNEMRCLLRCTLNGYAVALSLSSLFIVVCSELDVSPISTNYEIISQVRIGPCECTEIRGSYLPDNHLFGIYGRLACDHRLLA